MDTLNSRAQRISWRTRGVGNETITNLRFSMISSEHLWYPEKKFDNSSFSHLILKCFSLKSFVRHSTEIDLSWMLNQPILQLWMTNIIISFSLVCFCSDQVPTVSKSCSDEEVAYFLESQFIQGIVNYLNVISMYLRRC